MPATTLPDAILQALRVSPVAALVGDTFDPDADTGDVRIGFDYLMAGATLPYVVITEPGESRTYFTGGGDGSRPFLADGGLSIECHHSDRGDAEALAVAVIAALNDKPLAWGTPESRFMNLRGTGWSFAPTPEIGSGSPTHFLCVVPFEFTYQGSL